MACAWGAGGMVAGVWLALAFGFLAALLALRVPHLRPPPPPGAASLSLAGLFHDLIRYGKTKNGYGKRPACLQRLDVPKRFVWPEPLARNRGQAQCF